MKIKSKNTYSIIISTLNEECFIEKNIDILKKIIPGAEIIVVDGGSSDETINICTGKNIKLIRSKSGRGVQLNEGAKSASGNILFFLHADTFLPSNVIKVINSYFANDENQICQFKLSFDINHWLLNLYSEFSKFDTIFTRFGDTCIVARKDFFNKIGGFPEWNFMEDVELLRKASKISRVKVLEEQVITSVRAFAKNGIIKQQVKSGLYLVKYLLGFRKFISDNQYYNDHENLNKTSIIIFVKYPAAGKVKTRLAATMGNYNAKELYKIISKKIIDNIKQLNKTHKYIFYADKNDKEKVIRWLGKKFFYSPQDGNSLGERMMKAFEKVFSHGANKAIIIGTDIPDLTKEIIEEVIKKLNDYDIIIGPSRDGGYYLLGMNTMHRALFEVIEFSTPLVLGQTINKIESLGLKYFLLPELQDIDTEEELLYWLNNNNSSSLKKEIALIYSLINGKIPKTCVRCPQLY